MTQIASLLAVSTVFVDLWAPFYSQGGGGGLIRETKLPMQELELKMEGGLCARGGVIAGFYGNCKPARTEALEEARARQSSLSIAASAQQPCCSERSGTEVAISLH